MVGHLATSLRRVVAFIAKGLTVIALTVLTALVILFFAVSVWGHGQTEKRITGALANHYAPAAVGVVKRQDWKMGGRDFSFGGQICFEIDVANAAGRSDRRVAMVADDDDGGAFYFTREYDSFSQCTADFHHG